MVDAGRGISWSNWLDERDAAPLDVFSAWLREQVPRASNEQRAPSLNRRGNRFEELSWELFNVQRRSPDVCTVEQADLLQCVETMAAMKNSDSTAAKVKCQQKLRSEFGPPELLLPYDLFQSHLAHSIDDFAQNEQGREVILQYLIVQAHLNREAREAEKAASLSNDTILDDEDEEAAELAIAPADDRGPGELPTSTVAIVTPQGRCRTRRKKGGMFRAVCG